MHLGNCQVTGEEEWSACGESWCNLGSRRNSSEECHCNLACCGGQWYRVPEKRASNDQSMAVEGCGWLERVS